MKSQDEWTVTRETLIHRLLGVCLLVLVWTLGLAGRAGYLQLYKGQEYRLQGEQQQIGFIELSPKRGDILDRHLDALAISVQIDSLFAHPREIREPRTTAAALAPLLEQDEHELYRKLVSDRAFVYLARKIPPRQAEQIRRLDLKEIYFQQESHRVYPGRELAAHVLGFVGIDNEGLSGLEYLYNDYIKGKKSRVHLRFDAKRQSYDSEARPRQSDGHTLVLNIDSGIQYIVQQVLEDAVRSRKALNGSAIVMNPHSGDVLAMASYPFFNPNRYADFGPQDRRNRAILDIYEPGSTFKVVTFAGVLNEGLVRPSESIDCRVGTLRIAGKVYREATHSFGHLTFEEILAKSSNVGTIKLGLRLGEERLYQYIRQLGFGQKTGIDLPGEQSGLLRPPSQWSRVSIGALSIGQEVGVTPLQMLRATCAIANGGDLVVPRVVRRILTPQGETVAQPRPARRRVLEADTARRLAQAMARVVEEGTGQSARLGGYSSAGKTGTAQKFIDGHYSDRHYIASYVGFAPLGNPVLAAIVVLNEPEHDYYGGQVAGPAFQQIMERALIHLRVPRDRTPAEEDLRPVGPPRELVGRDGISIEERGLALGSLEETVLTLIREKSPDTLSRRTITVETDTFPLPDFTGMSLREVARECARLGLRLKVSGTGMAVGQRPAPATEVAREAVCEVFFSSKGSHAPSRVALRPEGDLDSGSFQADEP